jgi:hypothetical protein
MTRRDWLAAAASFSLSPDPGYRVPNIRSFWVLKLLRPPSMTVRPCGTSRLHCVSEGDRWIVESSQFLSITPTSRPFQVTGPAGEPVGCILEVPGSIRRSYFGTFDISSHSGVITPVVSMSAESATGRIVGAELPVDQAGPGALRAQAIVSRSILCAAAKPRHYLADFCDTTHCQFLRSPALPGGAVADAVNGTKGVVLWQGSRILPALYSAACGGRTESGIDRGFQYTAVACEVCRNSRAVRRGHGWGLCQEGALGLARRGWSERQIVARYYPNAVLS